MRRRARAGWTVAGVWLAATVGCGGSGASAPAGPANPFADALWDDGRAEIALYAGTTPRYGIERPLSARIIVVKEDLLLATLVKSETGPVPGRTVEVLKMNLIADFPTGTYDYHEMASVFLRRADLSPLKETMSHTEGCGITFVRVGPRDGRLAHEAHSYWEGEADRVIPIEEPRGELLWADALPVSLRRWAGPGEAFERRVWLLPSQVSGRSPAANARPVQATLRLVGTVPLSVPDGEHQARYFTVTAAQGTDHYWFDAAAPHVLLRLETAAGRRMVLENVTRLDYWNHTGPGDERRLRE